MTIINQLTFLSLLGVSIFFTACNGQVKTNLPKENATVSARQSKLTNTKSSDEGWNVGCSLQDRKGNLWFGTTGEGVYRYDGKSFTNFTTTDGLNSNFIFSIVEDKKGNLWFATTSGVSHYDGKTFTDIPIPNNFVTSILEDKSGKFWFATKDGVYCYNGKDFTLFLDDPSIINRNRLNLQVVQCMLEDKQGNIWFTTKTEGVCRYDGKSIINYTPNDELWFRGILEDNNGNIWVGGRYIGAWRFDGKSFAKVMQSGRFDSYIVLSIIQDKTGNLWFGTGAADPTKRETEGGVWRYDGKNFKNFTKEDGLIHNDVTSLLEDKAGNIWIGTRNVGLSRFDGETFTSFSE